MTLDEAAVVEASVAVASGGGAEAQLVAPVERSNIGAPRSTTVAASADGAQLASGQDRESACAMFPGVLRRATG